ncbi:MAG TPA: carboxymuconolactone decarboxylase family protein [Pseudoxanthomonas sp.]|nr:carboxymuconolactone decarboxylase family protein [Pseudoxanthomonas sp.]
MPSFTTHTVATAPASSRPLLAQIEAAWGFLPNLHAVLAESPEALEGYHRLFGLAGGTGFTPAEQQLAFLVFSVFHGCAYCTMGHTWLARQAGLDEASVQALRGGGTLADPRMEALRAFALRLVGTRGQVGSDALASFLDAGFERRHVLDLLVILAAKVISNYADHIAGTPREAFMHDPALAWSADRAAAGGHVE